MSPPPLTAKRKLSPSRPACTLSTWRDYDHPIRKVRLRKIRCEYGCARRWRHSEPGSLRRTRSSRRHRTITIKAQSVCTGKHWLLCRELGKITSSSAAAGTTMEKRSRHFIARESAVAKAVVNVAKAHYAQAERERACCLDDSKTRDTS